MKKSDWNLHEAYEIINRSPAIAFLWIKAEGWPVEFVSENVATLCGYSAEEFINGIISYVDLIHPDDLDLVADEVSQAEQNQLQESFQHTPYRIITRDEEIKWVDDNSSLKRNKQGEITHYRSLLLDITQRKKNEDILQRSKQHWEKTFDAIPALITLQDKDMRIIRTNKAAADFFQSSFQDVIGKHCYQLFRKSDEPCAHCPTFNTLATACSHTQLIEHKIWDRTFQVTSSPVIDDNGEVTHLVHTAKDVTEQKRLEKQLLQAHKMEAIGTLAGGIAHDFNNLLTVILGSAEIVKYGMKTGMDPSDNLEQVIAAGKKASQLVKQLLAFSCNTEHEVRIFDPSLVVVESLKMLRSSLPTTVTIQSTIDTKCGLIEADPTRISQIVVELCTNALHAMDDERGELQVDLKRQYLQDDDITEPGVKAGPFIVLSVHDSGSGMGQAIQQHVFDPYYTTKEVGSGSGLGLAVIHGIIRDYQGMIRVESDLGVGTSMVVYIPAQEEERDTLKDGNVEKPIGNERILLVDDENSIVKVQKNALEHLGYQVTATNNSSKALALLQARPEQFDMLITDQTMPEITGMELAEQALSLRPDLPILLCTGYSALISEQDVLDSGIRCFITKPIVGSELSRIVREVLDEEQR